MEKALEGISADHTVSKHRYSALDESGKLTKEHLFEVVRKNNAEYLKDETTGLISDIKDDGYLLRVCEIITETANLLLEKYPDIDKERVYCNLGFLKIIQKSSALDYAAVESDMVLHMNASTSKIADIMPDASMYSVIIHETVHILQYGCSCEEIDGCSRRCGLAHHYDDWEQDYADWVWFAEGSAERMTCLVSNVAPMTYRNMVNYIVSMDLVTMLQKDIPANYAETLTFYGEPDRLWELFGCKTEEDKAEIVRMMYALEIMQMEPEDATAAYKKIYGKEYSDQERDRYNMTIKRPIVQTLTKNFYRNLAQTATEGMLTENDLYFLLNLFEETIEYHLRFTKPEQEQYNTEFLVWYREIRARFWECFSGVSQEEYEEYSAEKSETEINASLAFLPQDKKDFLIDKYETVLSDYKIPG